MSSNIIKGKQSHDEDESDDMYRVAIVLYLLFHKGQCPYRGLDDNAAVMIHVVTCAEENVIPFALSNDVPENVRGAIHACFRSPTWSDMIGHLMSASSREPHFGITDRTRAENHRSREWQCTNCRWYNPWAFSFCKRCKKFKDGKRGFRKWTTAPRVKAGTLNHSLNEVRKAMAINPHWRVVHAEGKLETWVQLNARNEIIKRVILSPQSDNIELNTLFKLVSS